MGDTIETTNEKGVFVDTMRAEECADMGTRVGFPTTLPEEEALIMVERHIASDEAVEAEAEAEVEAERGVASDEVGVLSDGVVENEGEPARVTPKPLSRRTLRARHRTDRHLVAI